MWAMTTSSTPTTRNSSHFRSSVDFARTIVGMRSTKAIRQEKWSDLLSHLTPFSYRFYRAILRGERGLAHLPGSLLVFPGGESPFRGWSRKPPAEGLISPYYGHFSIETPRRGLKTIQCVGNEGLCLVLWG